MYHAAGRILCRNRAGSAIFEHPRGFHFLFLPEAENFLPAKTGSEKSEIKRKTKHQKCRTALEIFLRLYGIF